MISKLEKRLPGKTACNSAAREKYFGQFWHGAHLSIGDALILTRSREFNVESGEEKCVQARERS